MFAAADDLDALVVNPRTGPETVWKGDVDREVLKASNGWEDDDEAWREAVDEAFEKTENPRSKGTLTTKTSASTTTYGGDTGTRSLTVCWPGYAGLAPLVLVVPLIPQCYRSMCSVRSRRSSRFKRSSRRDRRRR